jgi:hypothetical protein
MCGFRDTIRAWPRSITVCASSTESHLTTKLPSIDNSLTVCFLITIPLFAIASCAPVGPPWPACALFGTERARSPPNGASWAHLCRKQKSPPRGRVAVVLLLSFRSVHSRSLRGRSAGIGIGARCSWSQAFMHAQRTAKRFHRPSTLRSSNNRPFAHLEHAMNGVLGAWRLRVLIATSRSWSSCSGLRPARPGSASRPALCRNHRDVSAPCA